MTDTINESAIRVQGEKDGISHFVTGVAVFENDKLLVVRRAATDDVLGGAWELPGGGVDQGETIAQGATRELFEETGLHVDKLTGTFASFDYSTPTKPKARQINIRVTVKPGTVTLNPHEHDEYRWIVSSDIPSLRTNDVMSRCLYDAFRND